MKQTLQILTLSTLVLTIHFAIFKNVKIGTTEKFTGKIESLRNNDKGIFPRVELKIHTNKNETKYVSLTEFEAHKMRLGKKYNIKAHRNWLVSAR